jgi:transaldolase/glucose-6-phosphate isomerase
MSNPLRDLQNEGVSVWLDFLSRDLVKSGRLQNYIDRDGLKGETSNPTIFQKSISEGSDYDAQILELARQNYSPEQITWELMIADVQAAADVFRPLYDSSGGWHGLVSLELDPTLAHDTQGSLRQARVLREKVNRPNVMFKVPGTPEGLPVIEELIAEGFNVNITLLFSVTRYEQVIDRYMKGLETRVARGQPVDRIASVASFFVSRVDTEVDRRLEVARAADPSRAAAADALKGRIAVANARVAYEKFEEHTASPRWKALAGKGARVQRPLWASTSTKNPAYSDILYVYELIGPDCINTMPEETMDAFRDHGKVERTITPESIARAHKDIQLLGELGVDLVEVTEDFLVRDGVKKFADSYRLLLDTVAREREKLLSKA